MYVLPLVPGPAGDGDVTQTAAADAPVVSVATSPAPLYVRGSAWTQAFKDELARQGVGTAEYGYRVDNLDTSAADSTLPWTNTNQIVLVYDRVLGPGDAPDADAFLIDGVRDDYKVTAVAPLGARAVALTLDRPLGNNPGGAGADGDRVTLSVPGGGAGGRTYSKVLNVLQGDANRHGRVVNSFGDLAFLRARLNKGVDDAALPGAAYTPWADVNANGEINSFGDLASVRARLNDYLPALTAPAAPTTVTPPLPLADELFGSDPILA